MITTLVFPYGFEYKEVRYVWKDKKLTRKQGCLYISALNKKNVIKILKRDFNINF